MTTENIQVDVADDGGSTRKLVASTDALAASLNKAADAEDRAQTALARTAKSAREAAAATDSLSRSNAEAAASAGLLQRAGTGASQAATGLSQASGQVAAASNTAAQGLTRAGTAAQSLSGQARAASDALNASSVGANNFARQASGVADGAKNAEAALARLGIQQQFVNKNANDSRSAISGSATAITSATTATSSWGDRLRNTTGSIVDWGRNVFTMTEQAAATTRGLGLFGKANDDAEKSVSNLGNRARGIGGEIRNSFGDSIQQVTQQLIMLAAAAGSVVLVNLTDQFNKASNNLISLTGSAAAAKDRLAEINAAVGVMGIPIENASQAYARFGANFRAVGQDTTAVMPLLQLLSMALLSSGTDAKTAGAGLVELSNAFKAGRTSGAELLAIADKYPGVGSALITAFNGGTVSGNNYNAALQRVAAQLDAAGGRVDQFAQRIANSNGAIQALYQQTMPTIGLAWQALTNALETYLGRAHESTAATSLVVGGLTYLSQNIGVVIGLFAALAAAVAVIGFAALIVSIGIVGTAFVTLATAMNGFIGITALVVGSVVGGVAALRAFASWLANTATQFPVVSTVAELLVRAIDLLTGAIQTAWGWLKTFFATLIEITGIGDAVSGVFDRMQKSVNDYITSNTKGVINTNALRDAFKNLNPQVLNSNGSISRIISTTDEANGQFNTYAGTLGTTTSALGQTTAATGQLDSATGQLGGTVRTVTDSMRGYGAALYGVSDAQNNLLAITGKTTAQIEEQKRAIAEASTYVDRYNNSVSAMSQSLGTDGPGNWGGTKGTISVPSWTYPGANQLIVGPGTNYDSWQYQQDAQRQKAWNDQLASLEEHGAVQDGRVNSNSDYIKAHPEILKQIGNAAMSGSGNLNRDLSNFIVAGKKSTDPTATQSTSSTSSSSGLNMGSTASSYTPPVTSTPVVTTPSTGTSTGGTVDTGATAAELSGLAAAAHAAALALNSIYSALAGQGVATFADSGIPGTGSASATPGMGTAASAPAAASVGSVTTGMGTGALTSTAASTATGMTAGNDNAASALVLDTASVWAAADAASANVPPSMGGASTNPYAGMTAEQIARAMIAGGTKTEADFYKPVENTTNKRVGTIIVNIGVKDTSQLGLNPKQKAQDLARELAKAV